MKCFFKNCSNIVLALGLLSLFCLCNSSCTPEPECECVNEVSSLEDGMVNVTLFFRNTETGALVNAVYTISAAEEHDCEVLDSVSKGFVDYRLTSCIESFYISANAPGCNKSVSVTR